MEDIAERIVAAVEPSDGWWKGDTQSSLEDAAVTLLNEGVDEEIVEETLHQIIGVLREEYGE
jgi:hypothetical protein